MYLQWYIVEIHHSGQKPSNGTDSIQAESRLYMPVLVYSGLQVIRLQDIDMWFEYFLWLGRILSGSLPGIFLTLSFRWTELFDFTPFFFFFQSIRETEVVYDSCIWHLDLSCFVFQRTFVLVMSIFSTGTERKYSIFLWFYWYQERKYSHFKILKYILQIRLQTYVVLQCWNSILLV